MRTACLMKSLICLVALAVSGCGMSSASDPEVSSVRLTMDDSINVLRIASGAGILIGARGPVRSADVVPGPLSIIYRCLPELPIPPFEHSTEINAPGHYEVACSHAGELVIEPVPQATKAIGGNTEVELGSSDVNAARLSSSTRSCSRARSRSSILSVSSRIHRCHRGPGRRAPSACWASSSLARACQAGLPEVLAQSVFRTS